MSPISPDCLQQCNSESSGDSQSYEKFTSTIYKSRIICMLLSFLEKLGKCEIDLQYENYITFHDKMMKYTWINVEFSLMLILFQPSKCNVSTLLEAFGKINVWRVLTAIRIFSGLFFHSVENSLFIFVPRN